MKYTFEAGSNCVYVPGVDISDTSADAVNRVLAYFSRSSKQDDPEKDNYDPYPLTDSVWVDLPEGHKFSYERIGRRRSYVMKLTEPCSHEELTAKAKRYLDENCGSVQYYEIEHVSIPTLRTGDVVRYINRYGLRRAHRLQVSRIRDGHDAQAWGAMQNQIEGGGLDGARWITPR